MRRAWSHGDPHLGNVLYDPVSQQARLLDFETQHERCRPAEWRHADDLLTLMLELISRTAAETWPALLGALLGGYDSKRIAGEVHRRLCSSSASERLLWLSRSPESTLSKLKASLPRVIGVLEARGVNSR